MDDLKNVLLNKLQEGTLFVKFNDDGSLNEGFFYICPKLKSLIYNVSKKLFQNSTNEYLLKDCEVRAGLKTDTWLKVLRSGKVREQQDDLAFSILHSRGRKSLDLLANDAETRDNWVTGLEMLIQDSIGKPYTKITDRWLEGLFNEADRNRNGLLCKDEVHRLLEKLNVRLTTEEFEQYFEQTDLRVAKYRGQLRVEDFITFYKILTYRPELMHIIHTYSGSCELCTCNGNPTISIVCSRLTPVIEASLTGLSPMKPRAIPFSPQPGQIPMSSMTNNYMTIEEVKEFMLNEQKQALSLAEITELIKKFDPSTEGKECIEMGVDGLREMLLSDENQLMKPEHRNTVYQDMNQPLTGYWINTSHNTYLCANQMVGKCTGESYVQALQRGCRSVELDLYDGADGRPVVRHAYTFIKDAYLGEILTQIKQFAFYASPYPLFLNLENHCSSKQQYLVAKLLLDEFGSSIYTAEEANALSVWPSPEQLKGRIVIRGRITPKDSISFDCSNEDESFDPDVSVVCKDLAILIACQNATFKGFAVAKKYKHTKSSSLSENKALALVDHHALDLILNNQRLITRVYPSAYRQDSSNIEAISLWNTGVHMVALNFQTGDVSMSLNHGRFTDNNQCGYILKPSILRENNTTFSPNSCFSAYLLAQRRPLKLELCVISAQHLPKRNQHDTLPVSPFVKVKIYGVRCDQNEQKTSAVLTNGLNPIWNHSMQFSICIPELCLIRFLVRDSDKSNTDLGQYSIPFLSMQAGYRHIRLLDRHNSPTTATLFVHVKIINMEATR
ncbi:unnamed protein product [Rotaria magnacalcarata]|uniref:Phosphoinositide phospholipase C n=4 Tax=Rotaria magnacalcarata TaxID=392030 RepID=A0A816MTZ6_9BILA|nr:unnamed protein product [Rotaria magnacalcarata]CAF2054652.1 unnamed protein product [Rotaria magnacalcarata]CAF2129054.1 unnamed protein product [Rotaria magnacalcarata]CAF3943007.1 unnamed protein product [Rotaria magnacalcarata]CAF3983178.1 unnamed protein product [Rotaria magnacalcarata]